MSALWCPDMFRVSSRHRGDFSRPPLRLVSSRGRHSALWLVIGSDITLWASQSWLTDWSMREPLPTWTSATRSSRRCPTALPQRWPAPPDLAGSQRAPPSRCTACWRQRGDTTRLHSQRFVHEELRDFHTRTSPVALMTLCLLHLVCVDIKNKNNKSSRCASGAHMCEMVRTALRLDWMIRPLLVRRHLRKISRARAGGHCSGRGLLNDGAQCV